MKRLVLWMSLLVIAFGLSTCSDEDMPRFQFNANGECFMPDARNITHEEFLEYAEGNGWQHVSTYEINRDGSVENKSYYEGLDGGGPGSYYFGRETYTSYFWFDAYPALAYMTYPYSYKDGNRIGVTNRLDDRFVTQLQVLSISESEFQSIVLLGIRSGENVYGLATYRKMTDEELKEYQEKYIDYYDLVYDASYMFRSFAELTVEKFEKEVVGYGWQWNYTYEISEDTTYTERNYYSDGDKTSHYYFEKDTLTRFYQKDGSFVYSKEPYKLMLDAPPYRLVNEATNDTLYLYFAQNPELEYREVLRMDNGRPVYGFTSLWRMSEAKLEEFRQKYTTEVKTLPGI